MTSLSKFFKKHMQTLACQDFLHAETCKMHLTKDILLYAISNLKYFAPICLLPILIKIQKINKKKLRKIFEYYLGCSLVGTYIGFSINLLMCLIRNIYGQFGYYSYLFIPSFLGSNLLYLGSDRVITLFQTTIFQCNIETIFLMRKNIFSRTIADSRILQTCLFMSCSAIILHCKRMYNTQEFWLLTPNPKINITGNEEQCSDCNLHPQTTCKQYLFNGLRKYFILGLSLDIIKMIISLVTSSTQKQLNLFDKLKIFRIRSLSLFTFYIGIYRFANCWLNRKHYFSDNWNHILSSFLAGSCYYLYPQSTLFAFALIQAIFAFSKMLTVKNENSANKTLELLLAIPYAKIIYPFAVGNMVHLTVLHPNYVSHLAATVANGVTNNYPSKMRTVINILKTRLEFESCH